jgi:hypothetical protein
MPELTFGNSSIQYEVTRSNRRETVGLVVDPMEGVIVIAPEKFQSNTLREIVRSKASWILEKQKLIAEIEDKPKDKEYLSGEKFPYLGRYYRLKVIRSEDMKWPHVTLKRGKFLEAHYCF